MIIFHLSLRSDSLSLLVLFCAFFFVCALTESHVGTDAVIDMETAEGMMKHGLDTQDKSKDSLARSLRVVNETKTIGQDTVMKLEQNCFPTDHEVFTVNGFMDLEAIQRHFTQHASLLVAAYVDGELQYHD